MPLNKETKPNHQINVTKIRLIEKSRLNRDLIGTVDVTENIRTFKAFI